MSPTPSINPNLGELLARTDAVMNGSANGWHPDPFGDCYA
jgi:hypothetical protein